MSLSIPFPFFGWLLNKKAARVEVNISLAFLHWVRITFHPWPFVCDIAIFVLKRDVKLQLTNFSSSTSSPGWSWKKGRKTVVCVICGVSEVTVVINVMYVAMSILKQHCLTSINVPLECVWIFITRRICAAHTVHWYWDYSWSDFEVFSREQVTHCTDGSEIWRGRVYRISTLRQILPPLVQGSEHVP